LSGAEVTQSVYDDVRRRLGSARVVRKAI
jgi:hypothetical protein